MKMIIEIKEYKDRVPVIGWISKWAIAVWEENNGRMESTKRRQIENDVREDEKRKVDIATHAAKKHYGEEREKRQNAEKKSISRGDQHSHAVLNANKIGKPSKKNIRYLKPGFYVPGTSEYERLKIKFALLEDAQKVCIDGQSYLMNCKRKIIKNGCIAVSMCGQSVRDALLEKKGVKKELISRNVSIHDIATKRAVLVAVTYDGHYKGKGNDKGKMLDKYKLQSIYEAPDATTLALAGALDDLIKGSKTHDYQEDIFDREGTIPSTVLGKSPLENVVFLLAHPDLLRSQIRTITGDSNDVMELPTIVNTYDSEMPIHIDRQSYRLLEHLETPEGATKLEEWIKMHPTPMSIDNYTEWLFTPDGEHMLSQFWDYIDDESFLIESVTNDEDMVGLDLYELITSDQPDFTTREREQPVFTTREREPGYGDRFLSPTTVTDVPDEMCQLYIKEDSRKSSRKKK